MSVSARKPDPVGRRRNRRLGSQTRPPRTLNNEQLIEPQHGICHAEVLVVNVEISIERSGCGKICSAVLSTIPEWFGIPEANADYAAKAEVEPTVVAAIDDQPVGLLTMLRHGSEAAEVYLMAVTRERHRQGIGEQMLAAAETHLERDGVRFLQVKTLADSDPDPNYAATRAFYRANGFVDLEVFPTLWDPANPALQLIKTIG